MRILKGQEILPDDSTLVQQNISDDDTVNIVIEPEKEIYIAVTFGPEVFPYKTKNSKLIQNLKNTLNDNNQIVLLSEEFDLHHIAYASESTKKGVKLDPSLPFHYYDFPENEVLRIHVVKTYLLLNIKKVGESTEWTRKMAKSATVLDLKKVILDEICNKRGMDISLYLNKTTKLLDTAKIGEVVTDTFDTIYFLENKCFKDFLKVHYKGQLISVVGVEKNDTSEDLKMRVQDQMGIPVGKIYVKKPKHHNWSRINGYVIQTYGNSNENNTDE